MAGVIDRSATAGRISCALAGPMKTLTKSKHRIVFIEYDKALQSDINGLNSFLNMAYLT